MKTTRERQDERRQQKLDEIQRQVQSGSLVVRQMTAAERERNPPRPRHTRAERPPRRG